MAKFRTKPQVVEAVQWWRGMKRPDVIAMPRLDDTPLAYITTPDGRVWVNEGEWLIIENERVVRVVSDKEFRATHSQCLDEADLQKAEGQARLPNGYTLYWWPNGAGGQTYASDEVGGGVGVWDTCLVDESTLLAAIVQEKAQTYRNGGRSRSDGL